MKISLRVFVFCFLIFECSAIYSRNMNVGPGIWLTSNMDNESTFTKQFDFPGGLTFNYTGQDVLGVRSIWTGTNQYEVIYKFIQNVPVQIYLAIVEKDGSVGNKLCQLNFFADKQGIATATAIDLQPSIIHCQFSGDPNQNDFTLTVQNVNKKRGAHA